MTRPAILAALALLALPCLAHADPCTAIPDKGPSPAWLKRGAVFSGTVRYVGDGDGLCVGKTSDPAEWIEVRLTDFLAPELHEPGGRDALNRLSSITMGREAICTVEGGYGGRVRSYDRALAVCRINGRRIGDLLRAAGGVEGGRGR